LRDYFELLKSGLSSKDVIKKGYDKHLIHTYNLMLKNKISMTYNEFVQEYDKGKSLDEIAKQYKVPRGSLTYMRQLFDVKKKGAKYINRKKTEISLNQTQKELIYGSLMGDGKRQTNQSFASFSIKHSSKQEKYVHWKYSILENIASKHSYQKTSSYDKRYGHDNESVSFYTHANSDVEEIVSKFYETGKKNITQEILDNLTDLSVAVWYMDDGTTDWCYQSRQQGWKSKPTAGLCTDSFSKQECELIQSWFLQKYNLKTYLRQRDKKERYRIRFDTEETVNFFEIIKPYIIASMRYKVYYEDYLKQRKSLGLESAQETLKLSQCPLGDSFLKISLEEKEKWVNYIFRRYKNRFPYPKLIQKDIERYIKKLKKFDTKKISQDDILYSGYPSSFIQSFHPHIYNMKNKGSLSPLEMFNNTSLFKDIIRRILEKGNAPTKAEIRRSFNLYRGNKRISIFPPYGAKAIYDTYCSENNIVLDFAAGFGSRLLGAYCSNNVAEYIACEPNINTYRGLLNIHRELQEYLSINKSVVIYNQAAEMFFSKFKNNSIDFVFTSPPYFDTEIYDDNESQSSQKYDNYADWFNGWLCYCIEESFRILKSSGKLVLNIANCKPYMITDDVYEFLKANNWNVEIHKLFISHNKYEPLLVCNKL